MNCTKVAATLVIHENKLSFASNIDYNETAQHNFLNEKKLIKDPSVTQDTFLADKITKQI